MQSGNYYKILGVTPNATIQEIKIAYRRLVLLYHPDRNKSNEAAELTKSINEAYATLSDDEKRRNFDAKLASQNNRSTFERSRKKKPSNDVENNILSTHNPLLDLDAEIQRLQSLVLDQDKTEVRDNFVRDLRNLYNEIADEINYQIGWINNPLTDTYYQNLIYQSMIKSTGWKLANETTTTLKNLTYSPANQQEDKKTILNYAKNCETSFLEKSFNFVKAIASILVTGLGFILGAGVGVVAGFIGGAAGGSVGAAIGGAAGGFVGGCIGAYLGLYLANKCMPLPNGSIKDALTFNVPFYSNTSKAKNSGMKFFEKNVLPKIQDSSNNSLTSNRQEPICEPLCKAEIYAVAKP